VPSELNLIDSLVNSNQNNHRLSHLKNFDELPSEAQQDITKLLNSLGDRAHQALGVLLWAFYSKGTPLAVISCRDLDALILEASVRLPEGAFSVRSSRIAMNLKGRKTKTVWAQLTAVYSDNGIITIIKPQKDRVPAVVELTHPQLLKHIQTQATDELRLRVVNSSASRGKVKFSSFEDFKASIQQDTNASRPQGLDTTTPQYSNSPSVSVTPNVTVDVTQDVTVSVTAHLTEDDFALCGADKINF
jgi:hypothetical protein